MKSPSETLLSKQFIYFQRVTNITFKGLVILLFMQSGSVIADDNIYQERVVINSLVNHVPPLVIAQADSSYLDALSAEAESTARVPAGSVKDNTYYKEMAKMENFIKNNRPSTYKFYKKLYPNNKAQIFEFYKSGDSDLYSQLSSLQKKVFDLYLNQ